MDNKEEVNAYIKVRIKRGHSVMSFFIEFREVCESDKEFIIQFVGEERNFSLAQSTSKMQQNLVYLWL